MHFFFFFPPASESLKNWRLSRFRKTLGASRCNNLTPATPAVPPEQIKRQHPASQSLLSQLNFLPLTEKQQRAARWGWMGCGPSEWAHLWQIYKYALTKWLSRKRRKRCVFFKCSCSAGKPNSLLSTPELFPLKYPQPHRIWWRPFRQVFQTNT